MSKKNIRNILFAFLLFFLFSVNAKNVLAMKKSNNFSTDTILHINVKTKNTNYEDKKNDIFLKGLFTNNNNSPPKELYVITGPNENVGYEFEHIVTIQIE